MVRIEITSEEPTKEDIEAAVKSFCGCEEVALTVLSNKRVVLSIKEKEALTSEQIENIKSILREAMMSISSKGNLALLGQAKQEGSEPE